jgi:glycosyltransferase involved in cell wall biosynthesis
VYDVISPLLVSVVIPARNEGRRIGRTVHAVLAQSAPGVQVEVVVVDDGSADDTALQALLAGARVVQMQGSRGNPGAARNRGAAECGGDPIVFLDADCEPVAGWLTALLAAHVSGATAVGGAIGAAPGQGLAARCNHYSAFYHAHPQRQRGKVLNHTPANLSVRRAAFSATSGFNERHPAAAGHEELAWQSELKRQGGFIVFEPSAVVLHRYRSGWIEVFRRNYRWAYSAIRCKVGFEAVRFRWLYRRPGLLILSAPVLALVMTIYTALCWARGGVFWPILLLPMLFAARIVYAAGFAVGGARWLLQPASRSRPWGGRWR